MIQPWLDFWRASWSVPALAIIATCMGYRMRDELTASFFRNAGEQKP
jgi:hypothetical protein